MHTASELGQERKGNNEPMMSAFTPLATFERTCRDVCLVPTPAKVQRSKIAPFASAQNRSAGCGCSLTIQHVRYSSDGGAREDVSYRFGR
jgi:hypothetical protein